MDLLEPCPALLLGMEDKEEDPGLVEEVVELVEIRKTNWQRQTQTAAQISM